MTNTKVYKNPPVGSRDVFCGRAERPWRRGAGRRAGGTQTERQTDRQTDIQACKLIWRNILRTLIKTFGSAFFGPMCVRIRTRVGLLRTWKWILGTTSARSVLSRWTAKEGPHSSTVSRNSIWELNFLLPNAYLSATQECHFTHLCVHYIVVDTKPAYRVLVGKPDVQLPEGRPRLIWEDNSEINPTRCNNCVYSSQWLYSTCFGWQFHPSSGVQCCIWPFR